MSVPPPKNLRIGLILTGILSAVLPFVVLFGFGRGLWQGTMILASVVLLFICSLLAFLFDRKLGKQGFCLTIFVFVALLVLPVFWRGN